MKISELCSYGGGNETEKLKIIKEIIYERIRQYELWGEQDHTPLSWLPILAEEFGEVSEAICEIETANVKNVLRRKKKWFKNYRKELIEVAAVAVAMIESFDRNKGV